MKLFSETFLLYLYFQMQFPFKGPSLFNSRGFEETIKIIQERKTEFKY
jgi:hypothetical protein